MLVYSEGGSFVQERGVAENGRFKFTGTFQEPRSVAIRLDRNDKPGASRDNISLYLEPRTIFVISKDSLKNATIEGGQLNAEALELKKQTGETFTGLVALRMKAFSMPEAERKSKSPAMQALNAEYDSLTKKLEAEHIAFIRQHPNSYIALETLLKIAGAKVTYEKFAPLFEQLGPSLKNLKAGKEFAARLETAKLTASGVKMQNFVSYDTARNELQLKDMLRNSKLTLVDFWASWCGPCRAENPNVVKAFNAFHDKGFNIISVSLDDNADRWKAAIIKDGMPWYHVSGLKKWDEPVAKQFGVNAVPDNFLLDADGKVIGRGLRGEALYKAVEEKLK